jgi:hypothetical protein
MRTLLSVVITIAGTLSLPAMAAAPVIYKCVAANGKVTYSESPCYGEAWHRFGTPPPNKAIRDQETAQAAPKAAPAPKGDVARPRVVKLPTPP